MHCTAKRFRDVVSLESYKDFLKFMKFVILGKKHDLFLSKHIFSLNINCFPLYWESEIETDFECTHLFACYSVSKMCY